jgi:hypothetical protein
VYVGSYDFNLDDRSNASAPVERRRVVPGSRISHPERGGYHDLMLFKIEPVESPQLAPIDLNIDPSNPVPGQMLTMIGYGETLSGYPTKLHEVRLAAVDPGACNVLWKEDPFIDNATLLCARGPSSTVAMRPCRGTCVPSLKWMSEELKQQSVSRAHCGLIPQGILEGRYLTASFDR